MEELHWQRALQKVWLPPPVLPTLHGEAEAQMVIHCFSLLGQTLLKHTARSVHMLYSSVNFLLTEGLCDQHSNQETGWLSPCPQT